VAKQLEIDALSRKNEVLSLQEQLTKKASETTRLYLVILLGFLATIVLWAFRTKHQQLHFKKLAQHDSLTGISNRHHFFGLAENALDQCQKSQQEASVMILDLDNFKTINDSFGHAAGDHILQKTADACKEHLRTNDIFGRIGGEEFAVLMPACNAETATALAEKCRAAVEAIAAEVNGARLHVSASFGITVTSKSGYALRQMVANADHALYKAKNQGRNRVAMYV
jgi:diguanylate cyclase (GGDEF)-like protein